MKMSDFTLVMDRLLLNRNVYVQRKGPQLLNDKLVIQPLGLSSSLCNLTILCQLFALHHDNSSTAFLMKIFLMHNVDGFGYSGKGNCKSKRD